MLLVLGEDGLHLRPEIAVVVAGQDLAGRKRPVFAEDRLLATAELRLLACGQKEWLTSLSPTAQLFLTNGVVIAITLGILFNAVLRAALGRAWKRPPNRLPGTRINGQ